MRELNVKDLVSISGGTSLLSKDARINLWDIDLIIDALVGLPQNTSVEF